MDIKILDIFFTWMWKKHRKHYCEACGKKILATYSDEVNTTLMDHLLEKSIYPECAYSKSNILWVHSECHTKRTNGFPLPKHKEKIRWAKENYTLLCEENDVFLNKLNKIYGKSQR